MKSTLHAVQRDAGLSQWRGCCNTRTETILPHMHTRTTCGMCNGRSGTSSLYNVSLIKALWACSIECAMNASMRVTIVCDDVSHLLTLPGLSQVHMNSEM